MKALVKTWATSLCQGLSIPHIPCWDEILIVSRTASDLVSKLHLTSCILNPFLVPAMSVGVFQEVAAKTVRNTRGLCEREGLL